MAWFHPPHASVPKRAQLVIMHELGWLPTVNCKIRRRATLQCYIVFSKVIHTHVHINTCLHTHARTHAPFHTLTQMAPYSGHVTAGGSICIEALTNSGGPGAWCANCCVKKSFISCFVPQDIIRSYQRLFLVWTLLPFVKQATLGLTGQEVLSYNLCIPDCTARCRW